MDKESQRQPLVGSTASSRIGLTLLELIVVLAIIGALIGLLLPAVQAARESARSIQCSNHLRNIVLGVHSHVDAQRALPLGSDLLSGTEHAWATRILPYVEEIDKYSRLDLTKPWNDSTSNLPVVLLSVPIYRCPSARLDYPGKIDFGGVQGSGATGYPMGLGPQSASGCGAMIPRVLQQRGPLSISSVTDGTSLTLCIVEVSDRAANSSGQWACGRNLVTHFSRSVAPRGSSGPFSYHWSGSNAVYLDGHVQRLSDHIDDYLMGSMCTRSGHETLAPYVD